MSKYGEDVDDASSAQQSVLDAEQLLEGEDGFGEPERAFKLIYRIHEDKWERTETSLAVSKKIFAWGERRGCILVQEKSDGQIYVLKKPFNDDEPVEEVYNAVKIEAIANLMAQCYNARKPPRTVEFVPCFIYILAQRPQQPTVRVEPLIFNHNKARLRNILDTSQEELDTLEAFELFTYQESEKSFVVCNPCRVGDFWTEPELHSLEGSLGGPRNRGIKGINVFLLRHQYNDICAKIGDRVTVVVSGSGFVQASRGRTFYARYDAQENKTRVPHWMHCIEVSGINGSPTKQAQEVRVDPSSATANIDKMRKILEEQHGQLQLPPSNLSLSLPPRFPALRPVSRLSSSSSASTIRENQKEGAAQSETKKPQSRSGSVGVEDSGKTGSKSQAGGALGSRRGSRSSLGEFDDDLHASKVEYPSQDLAGQPLMLSQSRLTSVVTKSSGAGMGGAVGGNMSGWSAEGGHEESAVKGETGVVVKQKPGHDYYLIEEVAYNSPAMHSGVRRLDVLLGIDGETVTGMPPERVEKLLEGRHGSTVTLSLKDPHEIKFSAAVITRTAGNIVMDARGTTFIPIDPNLQWDEMVGSYAAVSGEAFRYPDISTQRPFVSEEEEHSIITENLSNLQMKWPQTQGEADTDEQGWLVNEEDVGEEVVVGLHVPPSNGLRVKMRPEFMSQGRGTITKVNEKRGFVSVRWDSGRNDPCLYVGGGGQQYFLEVLRFPADKDSSLSLPQHMSTSGRIGVQGSAPTSPSADQFPSSVSKHTNHPKIELISPVNGPKGGVSSRSPSQF